MIYILYNTATKAINAANNENVWKIVPTGLAVAEFNADGVDAYNWPNGAPNRCLYDNGTISGNPSLPDIRYKASRKLSYPPIEDYLDAQVKKSSGDPVIQSDGVAQEAKYISDCMAVKNQFPKPS